MADQVRQTRQVTDPSGNVTTERVSTVQNSVDTDTPRAADRPSNVAARVIWLVATILIVLLGFRFVFALLGANVSNPFVNFIYTVSHPFAQPFFSIFGYHIRYGVSRVELGTIVAIVVYALIAALLVRLVTIRQPGGVRQV